MGPASAGVHPPVEVEPTIMSEQVRHEEDNVADYRVEAPALGEYTGDAIPAELVRKARGEDVNLIGDLGRAG